MRELGVSALLSPSSGHSRRFAFLRYVLHASTFLRPFASRALPRFHTTMAALTPGWPALRHRGMNTVHTPARSPRFMHSTFSSFRRQPPDVLRHRFCTLPLSVTDFLPSGRSGLHHSLAGSPQRPAESRSSSYGPMVHLRLLSTSPHGDAVTFGYRPESVCLEGTCTPLIECPLGRTRAGFTRRFSMSGSSRIARCGQRRVEPALLGSRPRCSTPVEKAGGRDRIGGTESEP